MYVMSVRMQCWEKLSAKFPGVAKDPANLKSFFRVLCFRTEAVRTDKCEVSLMANVEYLYTCATFVSLFLHIHGYMCCQSAHFLD